MTTVIKLFFEDGEGPALRYKDAIRIFGLLRNIIEDTGEKPDHIFVPMQKRDVARGRGAYFVAFGDFMQTDPEGIKKDLRGFTCKTLEFINTYVVPVWPGDLARCDVSDFRIYQYFKTLADALDWRSNESMIRLYIVGLLRYNRVYLVKYIAQEMPWVRGDVCFEALRAPHREIVEYLRAIGYKFSIDLIRLVLATGCRDCAHKTMVKKYILGLKDMFATPRDYREIERMGEYVPRSQLEEAEEMFPMDDDDD